MRLGASALILFLAWPAAVTANSAHGHWYEVLGPWEKDAILAIELDSHGWPAVLTRDTLWQWDGAKFERIRSYYADEYASSDAHVIPESPLGPQVWSAQESRICRWIAGTWTCWPLPPISLTALAFASPDDGWGGGLFGHLYRWDGKGWQRIATPEANNDVGSNMHAIEAFASDDVWIFGGRMDLMHWDGERLESIPRPPRVGSGTTGADLCRLPDGRLLVLGHPAWTWDGDTWTAFPGESLRTCAVDGDGVPWVGGDDGYLASLDGDTLVPSPTPTRAPIQDLAFGSDGSGWAMSDHRLLRRTGEVGAVYADRGKEAGVNDPGDGRTAQFLRADGDAAPDLLLANGGRRLLLFRNDGDMGFVDITAGSGLESLGRSVRRMVPCDLDGDGNMDVLAIVDGPQEETRDHQLRYLRGWGDGRFEDASHAAGIRAGWLEDSVPLSMQCVDLDHDGDLDVHVTSVGHEESLWPDANFVFVNTGYGHLQRSRPASRGLGAGLHWSSKTFFVDLDSDGLWESLHLNAWHAGHTAFEEQPDGTWVEALDGLGLGRHYLGFVDGALGDLDRDGAVDLVIAEEAGDLRVMRNVDGTLIEVALPDIPRGTSVKNRTNSPGTLDDVDADGDRDILLLDPLTGARLLLNDGLVFTEVSTAAGLTVGAVESAAFGDADLDGDLDIYLVRREQPNQLMANAGPGTGRTLLIESVERTVVGARVQVFDAQGAAIDLMLVDHAELAQPLVAGAHSVRIVTSDGTEITRTVAPEGLARIALEAPSQAAISGLRRGIARRLAWLRLQETIVKAVVLLLVMAPLLSLGRRRRLLGFGRPETAPLVVLAFGVAELAVTEAPAVARWMTLGLPAGALLAFALDTRLTRLRRATWIARFRLEKALGAGGMGSVWLAVDSASGQRVALKILRPELATETRAVDRFHREARLGARFDHPHIVKVYEAGTCEVFEGEEARSTYWMAMEYIEGRSLRGWLAEIGTVPVGQACRLAVEFLEALQVLHDAGVIHRDIKPDNVLLTEGGALKLADFGLASGAHLDTLTRTGDVMGTVAYMPPEQAHDTAHVDARADVYAAGILLYELLCGRVPHTADNYLGVLFKVLNEDAPGLRVLAPRVPESVAAATHRAIEREPDKRFGSAAEFANQLRPYADRQVDSRSLRSGDRGPGPSTTGPKEPPLAPVKSPEQTPSFLLSTLPLLMNQLPTDAGEDALLELLLRRKKARDNGDTVDEG